MAKVFKSLLLGICDKTIMRLKNSSRKYEILQNHRVESSLSRQVKKNNAQLYKLLVATNTAEQIFDIKMYKAIKQYDLSAHWTQRAVNTKYANVCFSSSDNIDVLNTAKRLHAEQINEIAKKRAIYVEKWNQRKQAYLATHIDNQTVIDKSKQDFEQLLQNACGEIDAQFETKYAVAQDKIKVHQSITDRKLASALERKNKLLRNEFQPLSEDTVLSVKDLCMYFGGLHAVEKLSFDVKKGEIFGLIGPNGAGKTTVFNCITQFYKPTSGQLLFNDKQNQTIKLTDYAVHDIVLQGISRTFQNVEVIKEISVLENLLIAATRFYTSSILEHALHLPILRIEEKLIKDRALNLLELMGLSTYKDWYAYGLPYGILKKIEIARALMVQPKLIILDEPAAGLNDTETAELAKLIKRIRDEFNCTILLVEHDMSLVMSVCDRICAISFGKELATGTPKQIQADKSVQEAYLGVVEE